MRDSDVALIRQAEEGLLDARLAEARAGRPRFVLVHGEAGMGKTTLLRQFVGGIGHAAILHASGDESETLLRYGVMEQLVSRQQSVPGVLADLRNLSSPPPDPFVVGAALLALLEEMQQTEPVALVLDDAHWADAASQLALLFACRRLRQLRVLVVMAADRHKIESLLGGLRRLVDSDIGSVVELEGLGLAEVKRLAEGVGGRHVLSRGFVAHLREHTGGNPLEIRRVLDKLQGEAIDHPCHVPLPAPEAVCAPVLERLRQCPPESRRLVAAAAVVGMRCPLGLARRLAAVDHPLAALQGGVDARLVAYRRRDVAFDDPLIRAAVYHSLPISQQAVLHAGAAALISDEATRLRHLASAATEDDESLANTIADFARRESTLGSWASAAASFAEAARLVPSGRCRKAYVLEAVECQLVGGDIAAAAASAQRLDDSTEAAHTLYVRGRLARLGGRSEHAAELLAKAHEACPPEESLLSTKISVELSLLFTSLLRPAESTAYAEMAICTAAGHTPALDRLPFAAVGLAMSGRPAQALSLLTSLPPAAQQAGQQTPAFLLGRAVARLHAGEVEDARDDAAGLVAAADRLDQRLMHASGLAMLSTCEYRLGHWSEGIEHAELGVSLAEDADLVFPRSALHAAATWPLVGRGEWAAAEAHARLAEALAHDPLTQARALVVRAAVALARGQHTQVVDAVAALRTLGGPGAVEALDGLCPWLELEVEAMIALGRLDEASTALRRFEAMGAESGRTSTNAVAARLTGSLEAARGRDGPAHVAFARAKALGDETSAPFERAKTQAAYGAFLRRVGRRRPAAAELCAAREGFERLGARPSVERCDRELAASSLAPRRLRQGTTVTLTPQETSVAQLVAQGKSNRAVAEELVVSVNTIEYHLKNVYSKLGIRSRSQLTLRLARPGNEVGTGAPKS